MALAYFITFSTYGTWLHGTDKGKGSVNREHNDFGGAFVEPDPEHLREAREAMTQPAYTLDERRRAVVRDAVVHICKEKGWRLLRCMCGRTMSMLLWLPSGSLAGS